MVKGKKLSLEDQKVWDAVKKTVTPLHPYRTLSETSLSKPSSLPSVRFSGKNIDDVPLPAEWYQGTPSAPLPKIDRHMKRQVKQGKRRMAKPLDLHGLNQDQAYSALQKAIEAAIKNGFDSLIVITGKGGRRWTQSDAQNNIAYRKRSDFDQFGGILKRMVPLWLNGRDLAPFVHSYAEASKEDGGAGALYVILRRKPSAKKG